MGPLNLKDMANRTVQHQVPENVKLKHADCPDIVRLELTNTCNLACPHCRHHSKEKRKPENYSPYYKTPIDMTEDQVAAIFDEVAPYKPSVTLNVANEPLIAHTFPFAVRKVKECGLSGTFNTNGVTLDRKIAQLLVDVEYDSVNISIDAVTPETLKLARGITRLDHLIKNVEMLLEIRGEKKTPRVGVTFVETDYNYHEIVWNGERMNKLRDLHNSGRWDEIPFCQPCDYWVETFDMKEEERDGFLIRNPSPYTTFYNVKSRLDNWNKDLHDRQGTGKTRDHSDI
ncbi:MAG: radical SAM protein [Candidatus Omnitrophica bacterium]|nr:radical SAM protein [Candidatus Omnitrophota bacterium]